ncbi:Spore coat polysaccharide biosynthesis protein SpsK [Candidatus Zixiibacteriota bacterium]|nr:Spore coat polysaccharide biosynthesis protein SpsK [candidate division Zixibacteria bacterium]
MKRKILITGSQGQLGRDLVSVLSQKHTVTGIDIEDLDICDRDRTNALIGEAKPDIVIHTAAYTDVDSCESNRELAMRINVEGTENLALAVREIGARMIYYSTDYVFDGTKDSPYIETDRPNPMTIYGRSKWEGEKRVIKNLADFLIIRIAWVYGKNGKNFVKTMLKLGRVQMENRIKKVEIVPLKVVNDQFGSPTWTMAIVRQTELLLEKDLTGIVHGTSEGVATWYDFARAIFEEAGMEVDVRPCTTKEFLRPAPRPHFSVLENKCLKEAGFNLMPDWRNSLKEFFDIYREGIEI